MTKQEWNREFWTRCGAKEGSCGCWWLGSVWVYSYIDGRWSDPADCDLEILLDVLEQLALERDCYISVLLIPISRRYEVHVISRLTAAENYYVGDPMKESAIYNRKAAVIAAICKLIGLEMEADHD